MIGVLFGVVIGIVIAWAFSHYSVAVRLKKIEATLEAKAKAEADALIHKL